MRAQTLTLCLLAGCSGAVTEAADLASPSRRDLAAADLAAAGTDGGPPRSVVVLNEVFADGAGDTPDYGEVRNLANVPVDLSAFLVRDDQNSFALPEGTRIPAGGHLVVYFDKEGAGPPGIYTGFGLSKGGDELHLQYADGGEVVPPLRWGAAPLPVLEAGRAYGRIPDGDGPFTTTTPTPSAANRR